MSGPALLVLIERLRCRDCASVIPSISDRYGADRRGNQDLRGGLRDHFFDRDAGREFFECEARPCRIRFVHLEYAEFGDDHVDAAPAGQRQGALRDDLGLALFVDVLHHHDHAAHARDQIHRAAHSLDELARDHPVGDVTLL